MLLVARVLLGESDIFSKSNITTRQSTAKPAGIGIARLSEVFTGGVTTDLLKRIPFI